MARRRRTGPTKQETRGLIALIAGLFLLFAKVIEHVVKAIGWGIQHVSDDVKWTSEGVRNHEGNWGKFYNEDLHKKVFKYIAVICAIVGLTILADRPIAGLLFISVAGISYFIDKNVFAFMGRSTKEIIVTILVVSALISNGLYRKSEIEKTQHEQAEQARKLQQEIALEKKQVALLDSSNKLVTLGRAAFLKKKYEKANSLFDKALILSPTNDNALYQKGLSLKEARKFDKAISLFAQVESGSEKYDEALIEQGLCLIKKGDQTQAVARFKEASTLENTQGKKLYNKYNPIRKRIVGYITRCCDGSSSDARGQGACSHHGGVCNWNDPIYSESRKYE